MKTMPWKRTIPICLALLLPAAALAQTLPTATQVAAQIGVGWNVGNSLEVPGGETGWGNPAVNQQLITAVKNAGFNGLRIPCAWDSHADQTTMTIDPNWLARVKQVVDYAIGNGMYVILNEHWDGGWLEEHPLYSYQTAVNAKQKAYWTQIANYFKSYNEHLLFAGTNEVHADYGTPTTENITVQQSFNQTFVDAVRATGGNNATRPLVVQTYNTNIQHGLNFFTPPSDTAAGRLIVEVHYYDPYDYTLNPSGSCLYWGAPYPVQSACTWAYESYVDSTFAQVNSKWVAAGVPVVIGEYGVATRSGLDLASRQYYLKYINSAAARNGIKTFYWDNGVSGNNGFALFDRNSGAIIDQGALGAILAGANVNNSRYALTVTKGGTGTGSVTSSPTGISCGSTCNATFATNTNVTLTASADSGSSFAGWGGACSGTGSCTVPMTKAQSVTANFTSIGTTYFLTVTKGGTGTGTVTSSPSGVNCGATCAPAFNSGTSVTLTATPDAGSSFGGWTGACTGTGTCNVTMTAARNVTATFNKNPGYTLTVAKTGAGTGTVTSSPSGVSCGSTCAPSFPAGTVVTLTATADAGSSFAGWSGACTGTGTCTVTMNAAQNVTASFGGGGTTPCANPVTFSGNTGNFNTTGPVCYRTSATINGWGCYNFDGRTLTVGGVARTCGQMPLTRSSDGYTYFAATGGTYPWAGLYAW